MENNSKEITKYNYQKLMGRVKEMGYTQAKIASQIVVNFFTDARMNPSTFGGRINNNSTFRQREITQLVTILDIPEEEICSYFFSK